MYCHTFIILIIQVFKDVDSFTSNYGLNLVFNAKCIVKFKHVFSHKDHSSNKCPFIHYNSMYNVPYKRKYKKNAFFTKFDFWSTVDFLVN